MKTKVKISIILLAPILVILLNSCKKEEKNKIKNFQEKIKNLTQTNWKLAEFNYSEMCENCPDYSSLNECFKDNVLKFTTTTINDKDAGKLNASGTWTLTEGASTCDTKILFLIQEHGSIS
ncbi:MAG: hypothetical protein HND27_08340 [Bacteroidetes bacterium]|nr:hypothetical protein [Bacteroidota bacterium]MBV6460352.1 hypothetical protein [Flavobacteriales bacterium]WKZ74720.1 MAG: hypothetical protein QY303_11285 [Vicingaceae bacterium]MCL4815780.1 hypothetical protein [Flavobacteriales bacterium]NOG95774.1 hypothetical protein [Bacteroidota bacterium]